MFNFLLKEYNDSSKDNQDNNQVIRPKPPYTLFIAFGMWVSSAVCYYWYRFLTIPILLIVCVALFVMVIILYRIQHNHNSIIILPLIFLSLGLLIGIFAGTGAGIVHTQNITDASDEEYHTYIFEVIEDTQSGSFLDSCLAKTQLSNRSTVFVRLYFKSSKTPRYGAVLSASTQLKQPDKKSFQYFWSKEIAASAVIESYKEIERDDLIGACVFIRNAACDLFDDKESNSAYFLKAILFGERKQLSNSEFYQDVRVVGLAHLVAVSGAHLVVVSSFCGIVLQRIGLSKKSIVGIQILFVLIYLVLTAFPVSAIRAGFMSCIAFTSFYGKRRSSSLNGLSLCVMLMIAFSPVVSLSISFLLSTLSTLGIIVFARYFQAALQKAFKKVSHTIIESLSLTVAASFIITPITIALFSQVSLISPLANIVVGIPFTILCVFGLICVCITLLLPGLNSICIDGLMLLADAFCEFVSLAAQIPYASILASSEVVPACITSFFLTVFLWVWWPQIIPRILVCITSISALFLLAVILLFPQISDDEIIMLDVGQGDAFVIRSKGSAVLVDTGKQDYNLLEGLARQGIHHLDAVFISHADDDHCGSLSALRGVVAVDRVCIAQDVSFCGCSSCNNLLESSRSLTGEEGINLMKVGDVIEIGNFSIEIIWPDTFNDDGGNADSLSFLLNYGDSQQVFWSSLFCGDLEAEELGILIDLGRVGAIDILKVGHHGSRKSFNETSLFELSPRIALISVGKDNSYGHPTDEVINALNEISCEIARTDRDGDVICKLSSERIEVIPVG